VKTRQTLREMLAESQWAMPCLCHPRASVLVAILVLALFILSLDKGDEGFWTAEHVCFDIYNVDIPCLEIATRTAKFSACMHVHRVFSRGDGASVSGGRR
jgi:hypothetical protein